MNKFLKKSFKIKNDLCIDFIIHLLSTCYAFINTSVLLIALYR